MEESSDVWAENFSHSARLLLQQSWASFMLALCLRAVLISRMHAFALMHRRTLCENVDSAKINVPFYTTDIDILLVASMHRIVIHRIDISIHIDESLHTYYWSISYYKTSWQTFKEVVSTETLSVLDILDHVVCKLIHMPWCPEMQQKHGLRVPEIMNRFNRE